MPTDSEPLVRATTTDASTVTSLGSSHHFLHHGAFGNDRFGIMAERFARFFGTPKFIIGQTVLVVLWIAFNAAAFSFQWDPYPFILLNLAFSTQAAYAAPLILLAATRQAERDKVHDVMVQEHHAAEMQRQQDFEAHQIEILHQERAMTEQHLKLLTQNTRMTEEIAKLTSELHDAICSKSKTTPTISLPPEAL